MMLINIVTLHSVESIVVISDGTHLLLTEDEVQQFTGKSVAEHVKSGTCWKFNFYILVYFLF